MATLHSWCLAAALPCAILVLGPRAAAAQACDFQVAGSRANTVVLDECVLQLLATFGLGEEQSERGQKEQQTPTCIGIMQGLGSQFGYANNTRRVCWETTHLNMTSLGCEVLNTLAWELMAVALRHLAICSGAMAEATPDEATLEVLADETFAVAGEVLKRELELHAPTPLGPLLGGKLNQLREDFVQPLQLEGHTRQVVSRLFAFSRRAFEHVNWMIWRDTHYLWLQGSLRQGQVVHSAWGPAERWEELGANDAHSHHKLEGALARAPQYAFVNEGSQRQEVLVSLLKQFHKDRGSQGEVVVVEIGVFRAGLSQYLLEQLPFVRLLGVDPYIGKDGTFPGDFSETLDPDAALAHASAVYERFAERAQLLPATSEEAARKIPDGSIDAVFVDGCHLYECVDSDLQIWLPKLAGRGSLVAGHDFSPQWPGVVRAVHEHRLDGQRVFLGMDWTFWWYAD